MGTASAAFSLAGRSGAGRCPSCRNGGRNGHGGKDHDRCQTLFEGDRLAEGERTDDHHLGQLCCTGRRRPGGADAFGECHIEILWHERGDESYSKKESPVRGGGGYSRSRRPDRYQRQQGKRCSCRYGAHARQLPEAAKP